MEAGVGPLPLVAPAWQRLCDQDADVTMSATHDGQPPERTPLGERSHPAGSAPDPRRSAPRSSAMRAGVPVADQYWPCLLAPIGVESAAGRLEAMGRAVRAWDRRSLLLTLGAASRLALLADDAEPGATRGQLGEAVSRMLGAGRASAPAPRAVIGDRIGPDEPLAGVAARLSRAASARPPDGSETVLWVRHHAVTRLMEHLDPRWLAGFVEQQLGALETHDRQHGTSLERVLELALDHPDRATAADAAFMHRNTFRRQLRKARELLWADLDCPEERLAVHLALKMRALERHRAAERCAVHRAD